jgi:hypothetical protein
LPTLPLLARRGRGRRRPRLRPCPWIWGRRRPRLRPWARQGGDGKDRHAGRLAGVGPWPAPSESPASKLQAALLPAAVPPPAPPNAAVPPAALPPAACPPAAVPLAALLSAAGPPTSVPSVASPAANGRRQPPLHPGRRLPWPCRTPCRRRPPGRRCCRRQGPPFQRLPLCRCRSSCHRLPHCRRRSSSRCRPPGYLLPRRRQHVGRQVWTIPSARGRPVGSNPDSGFC